MAPKASDEPHVIMLDEPEVRSISPSIIAYGSQMPPVTSETVAAVDKDVPERPRNPFRGPLVIRGGASGDLGSGQLPAPAVTEDGPATAARRDADARPPEAPRQPDPEPAAPAQSAPPTLKPE